MPRIGIVTTMLGLLALMATTCVRPAERRSDPQQLASEQRHWVQDERLRSIMADLDREMSTSWPQEIEDEYLTAQSARAARAMEEACWLAEGLVNAAAKIPDAVAHVEMSDPERRAFLTKADTLRFQAQELQTTACAADVKKMRRVLRSIRTTCRDCHDRYRDLAGPLDRP